MSDVKRYRVNTLPGRITRDCPEVVLASDYDTLLIDVNTLNAAIEGLRETNREQRQERDGLVAALEYYAVTPSSYGQVARAALNSVQP